MHLTPLSLSLLAFSLAGSVQAADKPLHAMLILGGCCHDYPAQQNILKKGIEARANVVIDIVYSPDTSTKARFDMYDKADWAQGYAVIIHSDCSSYVPARPHAPTIQAAHHTHPPVYLH